MLPDYRNLNPELCPYCSMSIAMWHRDAAYDGTRGETEPMLTAEVSPPPVVYANATPVYSSTMVSFEIRIRARELLKCNASKVSLVDCV